MQMFTSRELVSCQFVERNTQFLRHSLSCSFCLLPIAFGRVHFIDVLFWECGARVVANRFFLSFGHVTSPPDFIMPIQKCCQFVHFSQDFLVRFTDLNQDNCTNDRCNHEEQQDQDSKIVHVDTTPAPML
jgi:hypothetical protein